MKGLRLFLGSEWRAWRNRPRDDRIRARKRRACYGSSLPRYACMHSVTASIRHSSQRKFSISTILISLPRFVSTTVWQSRARGSRGGGVTTMSRPQNSADMTLVCHFVADLHFLALRLSHELVKELRHLNSARMGGTELSRLAPRNRVRAVKASLVAHHEGSSRCC